MVMDFFKFFNVFVLATADHYSAIIGLTLTFSVAVMANFVLFRPLNRIKVGKSNRFVGVTGV